MRVELAVLAPLLIGAAPTATLTIDVGNVRSNAGRVHVDVCPEARFLKDGCPFSAAAPAHAGVTTITVANVPAGRYAVQAFHDENGNGKVDRILFGIPKEGVGFSRDAKIRMSPPKWNEAVFDFTGPRRIGFSLRYFLGSSGPSPKG